MGRTGRAFTRLAFSESVKRAQQQYGTRAACARLEVAMPANDAITERVAQFIALRDSFFLATASNEGWPHVQHRGGPVGFLKVLGSNVLAFGDFDGNKQLITVGNILENPHVHLLLIDNAEPRRLKLWGTAAIHPPHVGELAAFVQYAGYPAPVARIITVDIHGWDFNCGRHIRSDTATSPAPRSGRRGRG